MGIGCLEKSRQPAFYYEHTATLLGCRFFDAGRIPGIKMHPGDYMHLDEESHSLLAHALAEKIPAWI